MKHYHNIYTDSNFNLKSNILSDLKLGITLLYRDRIYKDSSLQLNRKRKPIVVTEETKVHEAEISISYLAKQMKNIEILTRQSDINHELSYSLFSTELTNLDYLDLTNASRSKYCKIKCGSCIAKCKYKLQDIDPGVDLVTTKQIKKEFKRHGHAQSRKNKITRKERSLNEAKIELKLHYLNYHDINE